MSLSDAKTAGVLRKNKEAREDETDALQEGRKPKMRRTLAILLLSITTMLWAACGTSTNPTSTTIGNTSNARSRTGANANNATSNNNPSDAAGIGPENQGIGGTGDANSNTRTINHNTMTEPPGVSGSGTNSNRP